MCLRELVKTQSTFLQASGPSQYLNDLEILNITLSGFHSNFLMIIHNMTYLYN